MQQADDLHGAQPHTKQGYTGDKGVNDCEARSWAGREHLAGSACSKIIYATAQLPARPVMLRGMGRPQRCKAMFSQRSPPKSASVVHQGEEVT